MIHMKQKIYQSNHSNISSQVNIIKKTGVSEVGTKKKKRYYIHYQFVSLLEHEYVIIFAFLKEVMSITGSEKLDCL
ncbi:hypothetical protein A4A49_52844 [Nicotiana attenuata]|uniref:Uncharacterized protein n=1 Tax=Nicotiana attenuata TaxID=49451 RepID=A0A314L4W2_NICAT|nr:hypothetical protein A4A49_52844 [Nicotiana attenuata]